MLAVEITLALFYQMEWTGVGLTLIDIVFITQKAILGWSV
jgi:hypothetical protein